jgi:hypothetical protein
VQQQLDAARWIESRLPDYVPGIGWRRGDKYDAPAAALAEALGT